MSSFDDDNLEPSDEELARQREIEALRAQGVDPVAHLQGRSSADDILDAVSDAPARTKDSKFCPVCGSTSKRRSARVGNGTIVRRCTNVKCKTEWPVGQQMDRTDPAKGYAPPPRQRAPFVGEGGPPIDRHQPIQRRLAEHIRRARDHEP